MYPVKINLNFIVLHIKSKKQNLKPKNDVQFVTFWLVETIDYAYAGGLIFYLYLQPFAFYTSFTAKQKCYELYKCSYIF